MISRSCIPGYQTQGKGKVTTYWLLGENCPVGDEFEDPETDNLTGLIDNLEEMTFLTKVTFCVSDHDIDAAQAAKL